MKAVIRGVIHSNVKIDGEVAGKIGQGFMILLGVMQGDTKSDADKLIKKIPNLRIFEDENGKMNLSCFDINGEMLICFSVYSMCGLFTRKKTQLYKLRSACRSKYAV